MDKLNWVLSSCVLILAALALRAAFGKRMRPGVRYALWGLVLLRLLFPGTVFHSAWSVASLTAQARTWGAVETSAKADAALDSDLAHVEINGGVLAGEANPKNRQETENGESETFSVAETAPAANGVSAEELLRYVWYAGMVVTGAIFLVSNLRLYLRIRRRRKPFETECGLPVYTVEGLASSCLFGRSVYLSAKTVRDPRQLRHILAHELSHERHGDWLWPLLRCVALILHWYNPLVWVAAFLSRRDAELFADAGALERLGDGERENYGVTLLRLSAKGRVRPAPLLCTTTPMSAGGKKLLKARITMIAGKRRMTVWAMLFIAVFVAFAAGCAFTGAEAAAEDFEVDPVAASTAMPSEADKAESGPYTVELAVVSTENTRYVRYTDQGSCKVLYDAYTGLTKRDGDVKIRTERLESGYDIKLYFRSDNPDSVQFTYGFIKDNDGTAHYGACVFDEVSGDWVLFEAPRGRQYWDVFNRYYLTAQSGSREIVSDAPTDTAEALAALQESDFEYYRQQTARWYQEVAFNGENFVGNAATAVGAENLAEQYAVRWAAKLMNVPAANPFRCATAEVVSCEIVSVPPSEEGVSRLACELELAVEITDPERFAYCMEPLGWTLAENGGVLRQTVVLRSDDGTRWSFETHDTEHL